MIEVETRAAQDNHIEVSWYTLAVPEDGEPMRVELRHTSFHQSQQDLLQSAHADMGTEFSLSVVPVGSGLTLEQWFALYVPPEPEPEPVPQEVTAFQAKAALDSFGLYDAVQTMMDHPDTPRVHKLAWGYASTYRRDSPTVLAMAAQLNISEEQMNALFRTASGITA